MGMKERGGEVILLGLTPTKLTIIFIHFICLTLIMMWASNQDYSSDDHRVASLSSFLPQHHRLFGLAPPDFVSDAPAGFRVTMTNYSASEPQRPPSISTIKHLYESASIDNEEFYDTKGGCDYGIGKWVKDETRPLYTGANCQKWLSKMWACRSLQRFDFAYEKFRWQPADCPLERFHGTKFLQRMQNKTLAFIGDSLGRQQFQSLMCMIAGNNESTPYVLDIAKEYNLAKTHKRTRPNGWAYKFSTTNTTILFYWSPCLCDLVRLRRSRVVMHVDRPPALLRTLLPRLDVLVLNTGHHWTSHKFRSNHWVIHTGGVPNPSLTIDQARNLAIHNIVKWVDSWVRKRPELKAFYRTISPRHFSHGEWNNGGNCDNTIPFSNWKNEVLKNESRASGDVIASKAMGGTKVKLLDITALSELREEGHVSKYGVRTRHGGQDCLHWCLPGIPDTWNEILFAQL